MYAYHELVADGEATFSNANANGNPNEQYVNESYPSFKKNAKEKNICFLFGRFIVKDRCTSYSGSQRSLMVMQVLLRTKYDDSDKVHRSTHHGLI